MQNVKYIKKMYKKTIGSYSLNGVPMFEYEDDTWFAFLPDTFASENVEYFREIRPYPFNWINGEPKFRFKVKIIDMEIFDIKEYETYINSIKLKNSQKKFHVFPEFLLKEWKSNSPKIFDAKIGETVNYHEQFFMHQTKFPSLYTSFIETFSIPVEEEISLAIKGKISNLKYAHFYSRLFKSRQLFVTDTKHIGNKGLKDVEVSSAREMNDKRDMIMNSSIYNITGSHGNSVFNEFSMLIVLPLSIKLPLSNVHYAEFIFGGRTFGVFPSKPDELVIIGEKSFQRELKKDTIFFELALNRYLEGCLLDKRSRWFIVDNSMDKKVMEEIKNKEYWSPDFITIGE